MYENIINKIEEITYSQTVLNTINAFYVFIVNNDGEQVTLITNGIPTYQGQRTSANTPRRVEKVPVPLIPNVWNPIALTSLEITEEMITNNRIFLGYVL